MKSSDSHKFKTSVMVALLIILNSAGNFFFGLGMKRIGEVQTLTLANFQGIFVAVFSSLWIWLGIISMLLFLGALMMVLSWADFSYVLPATAAMYAIVPLLGHFVLHESVTALRWTGVAMICAGILFVARTPPSTTEKS
jgi:drug/metabolite transporter (DMT)-like permease